MLTNGEIYFLDYLNGKSNNINILAKKYYYEYDLCYEDCIKKYLENDFLRYATLIETLTFLKSTKLKELLKNQSLKISGSKDEQIQRIIENISESELDVTLNNEKYFIVTPEGQKLVNDLEEDDTMDMLNKVNSVVTALKQRDIKTLIETFAYTQEDGLINPSGEDDAKKIIECIYEYKDIDSYSDADLIIIYFIFKSRTTDGISKFLQNTFGIDGIEKNYIHNMYMTFLSLKAFKDFKSSKITKYRIVSCGDQQVCNLCNEMNGKEFNVNEATIGVNTPPFCDNCRCRMKPIFKWDLNKK